MDKEKLFDDLVMELAFTQVVSTEEDRQVLAVAKKSIGFIFRSLYDVVSQLFGTIREPLKKLSELFVQQREKKKCGDPKSGWIMKFDMTRPSQVLLNKPRFSIRKII